MEPRELFRTTGKDGYCMVTVFMSDWTWHDVEDINQGVVYADGEGARGTWMVASGEVYIAGGPQEPIMDLAVQSIQWAYGRWYERKFQEVNALIVT